MWLLISICNDFEPIEKTGIVILFIYTAHFADGFSQLLQFIPQIAFGHLIEQHCKFASKHEQKPRLNLFIIQSD